MLCEEHCREIHNIEEAFHKVLKKVNYQNSKLKETVEEMKEEIDSLTAQLAETRQTLDAKSLVGKVREELSQQFLSFKKEVQIQIDQKFNTLSNGQLRITENVKNVLHQDKQLYSEALKPSKDVVILKPKSSQNANVTFETLQDKINPEEVQVGITKVKRLRNGSVAIACCNQEEANKLEEEVKTKMGKEYEVKKVKPHNPKIKIVGFNNEMTEEELKQCLINQNSSLKNMKDALCFGEHWLKPAESDIVRIESFTTAESFTRSNHTHGGVIQFILSCHQFESLQFVKSLSSEIDCEIIGTYLPEFNLYLIVVYRSPLVVLGYMPL
ncbi:hypothetical protein GEV33_001088 [Tenebrio molitor]|uniref:Uncharacterized protein n=1 Tax=Tenebrio molitor TaxID=7067 RepID=A0A8J6HYB9_TENMO|nr:hypothetical protein GEV33_001088 [Tenebrio molitor]